MTDYERFQLIIQPIIISLLQDEGNFIIDSFGGLPQIMVNNRHYTPYYVTLTRDGTGNTAAKSRTVAAACLRTLSRKLCAAMRNIDANWMKSMHAALSADTKKNIHESAIHGRQGARRRADLRSATTGAQSTNRNSLLFSSMRQAFASPWRAA